MGRYNSSLEGEGSRDRQGSPLASSRRLDCPSRTDNLTTFCLPAFICSPTEAEERFRLPRQWGVWQTATGSGDLDCHMVDGWRVGPTQ